MINLFVNESVYELLINKSAIKMSKYRYIILVVVFLIVVLILMQQGAPGCHRRVIGWGK